MKFYSILLATSIKAQTAQIPDNKCIGLDTVLEIKMDKNRQCIEKNFDRFLNKFKGIKSDNIYKNILQEHFYVKTIFKKIKKCFTNIDDESKQYYFYDSRKDDCSTKVEVIDDFIENRLYSLKDRDVVLLLTLFIDETKQYQLYTKLIQRLFRENAYESLRILLILLEDKNLNKEILIEEINKENSAHKQSEIEKVNNKYISDTDLTSAIQKVLQERIFDVDINEYDINLELVRVLLNLFDTYDKPIIKGSYRKLISKYQGNVNLSKILLEITDNINYNQLIAPST